MNRTMYLQASQQFLTDARSGDTVLKQCLQREHRLDGRRMNRLTLLSLLGVLPCPAPKHTGVYLASSFASPSKMTAMLHGLLDEHTPRPFDFIGNIHNAAPFYIAQALGLAGPTLFVAVGRRPDSWVQPLLLAIGDLLSGQCDHALVGWCHEHKAGQEPCNEEGSHWLSLSTQASALALGTLTLVRLPEHTTQVDTSGHFGAEASDAYFFQAVRTLVDSLQAPTEWTLTTPLPAHIRFVPLG